MDLHYIWIGDPKDNGHDVNAPQNMLAAIDLSSGKPDIHFWCLNKYVEHYKSALSGIKVCGVEEFLQKCTWGTYRWRNWFGKREDWVVEVMTRVVSEAKETKYIRDIVNAKNLFSLFLLYSWGGYTMDSNVNPDNPTFSAYPNLKVPCMTPGFEDANMLRVFKTQSSWYDKKTREADKVFLTNPSYNSLSDESDSKFVNIEDEIDMATAPLLECWMMYSPKYNDTAWSALEYYAKYMNDAVGPLREKFYSSGKTDKDMQMRFHDASAGGIIGALYHAFYLEVGSSVTQHFWQVVKSGDHAAISEVGIYKIYNNTHKLKT